LEKLGYQDKTKNKVEEKDRQQLDPVPITRQKFIIVETPKEDALK
jgi:hypothetical protein